MLEICLIKNVKGRDVITENKYEAMEVICIFIKKTIEVCRKKSLYATFCKAAALVILEKWSSIDFYFVIIGTCNGRQTIVWLVCEMPLRH